MTDAVKVGFVSFSGAPSEVLVVFCDDGLEFGPATRKALGSAVDLIKQAAETNQFKGKNGSILDILAPQGLKAKRLIVVGAGKLAELKDQDFLKLGGTVAGKLRAGTRTVTVVIAELPKDTMGADQAAAIAAGIRCAPIRSIATKPRKRKARRRRCGPMYRSRWTTLRPPARPSRRTPTWWRASSPRATSSMNRPTSCFPSNSRAAPDNCASLAWWLMFSTSTAMKKLGMGALLGVAQGSTQPGRTVIMRWNGGKKWRAAGGVYRQRRLL